MTKKTNLPASILSLYDAPTFRLLRELNNSPALQVIRDLQQSGGLQELTRVSHSHRALFESLNSTGWLQMQSEVGALGKVIAQSESLSSVISINADLARSLTLISTPVFPEMDRITDVTRALSDSLQPFQSDVAGWSKRLQEQMGLLREPWALAGIESVSITGFARISSLSNYALIERPFSDAAAAYYRDQLFTPDDELMGEPTEKDKLAVKAGLNPELIAFYPSEYSHVLAAAGFSVSFSQVRIPVAEGSENSGEAYNPAHDALLKQVEIWLRQLIEQSLRSLVGESWVKKNACLAR